MKKNTASLPAVSSVPKKLRKRATMSKRTELIALMTAAGCTDPRNWVGSELSENKPQFARFLFLKEFHEIVDEVENTLAGCEEYSPDISATLKILQETLSAESLHTFLRIYGKALGNAFVMMLDYGPEYTEAGAPGWALMETNTEGETTDRLIQGLHEDYLDFEESYVKK